MAKKNTLNQLDDVVGEDNREDLGERLTSGSEVNHPFAGRLRSLQGAIRLSDFARKCGIRESLLRKYLAGSTPGVDKAAQIAVSTGASLKWLATGEGAMYEGCAPPGCYLAEDFVMVPRYDVHGSAGHGTVVHSEQIVDYLAFRSDWVRNALGIAHKDLVLISVKGDSMEPTLSNGDLILIDAGTRHVEDSAIYVLKNHDGLLVKRLQHKVDGSVVVKSDNAKYESEVYDSEAAKTIFVVGRVVWAGRKL